MRTREWQFAKGWSIINAKKKSNKSAKQPRLIGYVWRDSESYPYSSLSDCGKEVFYVKSDHDTGNNVKCRKESDCGGIMPHFQTGWIPGGAF